MATVTRHRKIGNSGTTLKVLLGFKKRMNFMCVISLALVTQVIGMGASTSFAQARSSEPEFTATVDQTQIGMDDTVSLKFSLQAEGSVAVSPPTYEASEFQEINSYQTSSVESYYDSSTSNIITRNVQSLTRVLKPMRTGVLRISRIRVNINGKIRTAPDLVVQVGPGGAGTAPPRNYGGGGIGLRGALKRPPMANTVFVRAETDKEKVFKGEQIIVSYYLYRRVRVLNAQVDKFPTLNGFLREELEMPIMQPRLEAESVVLDGVHYQRSLLTRYAAYPLQEGKLNIDPMGLKYNYYAESGITDDGEDPFMQFFKQLTPREGNARSESVTIDVLPLPADGRPSSFSGGVGDFSVTSAVDKYEVHANEALTLTVKIEGRGNVAAIGEPKTHWPPNLELYDSKGTARSAKGGIGEKIFEILLIPRVPGALTLPPLEFSFFDPGKKQYVTRTTEPIQIKVTDAVAGSTAPRQNAPSTPVPVVTPTAESTQALLGLKPPTDTATAWSPPWRLMYVLAVAALGFFGLWVAWDLVRGVRTRRQAGAKDRAREREKSWDRLRADARNAPTASWADILNAYERLAENLLDGIDRVYDIGARSLPRSEIRQILVDEKGLSGAHWDQIDRLLEFNELIRFAGTASASLETRARSELSNWVKVAETSIQTLQASGAVTK